MRSSTRNCEHFDGKIVRKDLTKAIKEGANVPVYVLEFCLGSIAHPTTRKLLRMVLKMSNESSLITSCAPTKRRKCCPAYVNEAVIQ